MRVKKEDLPNLFKPIYKRVSAINDALRCCGVAGCCSCRLSKNKDCYGDIAKEINEVSRLLGSLANGVKKID